MESIPKFIQGVFGFAGAGYAAPVELPGAGYTVPPDRRAQLIYVRAGNSTAELVYLSLLKDGAVMRLFPIGAKASLHVSLAVVEDLEPDTKLTLYVGAPAGVEGTIVLDLGLMEI